MMPIPMTRSARTSITAILIVAVAWWFVPSNANTISSDQELPIGAIAIWSESLSDIPAGWVLCDGTHGTPDLRGRLVRGTPDGENPGFSGGSLAHSHASSSHAHGVPAWGHTHTVSQLSASSSEGHHSHTLLAGQVHAALCTAFPPNCSTDFAGPTHGHVFAFDGGHDHQVGISATSSAVNVPASTTSTSSGLTNAASNLPAHQKVAFIMKVGA